jgi:putative FmdB family regulatory protein
MPTYDYGCRECGGVFESRQPIALRDVGVPCPNCGVAVARVLRGAPRLAGVAAATRDVIQAEERAMSDGYSRLRHPKSCGCC